MTILIAVFGINLIRQLEQEFWKLDESEADRFAIENLSKEECDYLYEELPRFLHEKEISPEYNEWRINLFRDAILHKPSQPRLSRELVRKYLKFASISIPLFFMGYIGNEMNLLKLGINSLLFIIAPIGFYIFTFIFALNVKIATVKAIRSMINGNETARTRWLDWSLPILKFILHA